MTPIDWGAIVGKVPEIALLLLFAVAFLELQKRWTLAQEKRDEMYEKRNMALVDAITRLSVVITALNDNTLKHTTEMNDAVDEMHKTSNQLMAAVRTATRPVKYPKSPQ